MSERFVGTEEEFKQTNDALIRVQEFDPIELVQTQRLGSENHFIGAVEPAESLVRIFKKLPVAVLRDLPDAQLTIVRQAANSTYNIFEEIEKFDVNQGDTVNRRNSLIDKLKSKYQGVFGTLYPLISFSMAQTVDFSRLEYEGRAAVQAIRDETKSVLADLAEISDDARNILAEVRAAAAEQGVSQEAIHFSNEATQHKQAAGWWLMTSIIMASLVAGYAVFSLFFPSIDVLTAENNFEAVQLTASKILIFFVLAYALFQCVKNYSAHKHNWIANRHRLNALMTYRALAEAGGSQEARDVILQHAAAAVYSPSDTGYLRTEDRGHGINPLVAFPTRLPSGGTIGGDI